MTTTNEVDLVVQYGGKKGGGTSGQLVIDDVELEESRDNRTRHGIGNEDVQHIERGNKEYTFSTTSIMSDSAAKALTTIADGEAETKAVYIKKSSVFEGRATGMVFNTLNVSASDGGDTAVDIDADLPGIEWSDATGLGE